MAGQWRTGTLPAFRQGGFSSYRLAKVPGRVKPG